MNDPCWLFSAAPTNGEHTLRVTDTTTTQTRTWVDPLDAPAAALTDTGAFASCL